MPTEIEQLAAFERVRDALAAQGNGRINRVVSEELPQPLKRDIGRAEPYPHLSLGPVLSQVAEAIRAATQAPMAIGAQSALAAANLCVQPHVNVELPTGDVKPVSEYLVTIAESGERKTAADERAIKGIRERELELSAIFRDEWKTYRNDTEAFEKQRAQILASKENPDREDKKRALDKLGDPPVRPFSPELISTDPTYEGLIRQLKEGPGYCGIFASEGGQFVGGHGMTDEAKLRTATGLSSCWDGTSIKRTRGGDGSYSLHGRRISFNLLVQPAIADIFFGDPLLADQGLLSRILATAPDPIAGKRPFRRLEESESSIISSFSSHVARILQKSPPHADGDPRELKPRTVRLSSAAARLWIAFHDHVEKLLAPEAPLTPIKPLASKAPEHAARLAATIEAFEDLDVEAISAEAMQRGINLVEHYLAEALRIYANIQDCPDLKLAEKTLSWIRSRLNGTFTLRELYQLGPYAIRDSAKARAIVNILVEHGWVEQLEGGAIIDNVKHREVFALTPGALRK
jgi:hypothetical protein